MLLRFISEEIAGRSGKPDGCRRQEWRECFVRVAFVCEVGEVGQDILDAKADKHRGKDEEND